PPSASPPPRRPPPRLRARPLPRPQPPRPPPRALALALAPAPARPPRREADAAPPVPTPPGRHASWPSRSSCSPDDHLFVAGADDDLAGLFQRAHDLDDRALRSLDVAQPHRAQELHLLLERRHRTLRHRAEDLAL